MPGEEEVCEWVKNDGCTELCKTNTMKVCYTLQDLNQGLSILYYKKFMLLWEILRLAIIYRSCIQIDR